MTTPELLSGLLIAVITVVVLASVGPNAAVIVCCMVALAPGAGAVFNRRRGGTV